MNNVLVNSALMSGDWQKGNQAKYGFVPTAESVVELEMKLIDFSQITSGTKITLCDFTGGEGEQLYLMHEYVKSCDLTPISYYNEITQTRYDIAKSKYGHIENFNLLNCDFFNIKLRYQNGKRLRKDCVAIIRNNPPYMSIERYGKNVRAEEVFYLDNTLYNCEGGVHIFELRLNQLLGQNLMSKILFRYEDVQVFKFPEKEYKSFQQVCVIGKKKVRASINEELLAYWQDKLFREDILSLDEVTGPVITLDDKDMSNLKIPNLYRDGSINEITLTKGLEQVIDSLFESEKNHDTFRIDILKEKPIIEVGVGHLASQLASGRYNGLMGDVLIRGGSNKVTDIIQTDDDDKTTTEEIEVIKPFIEITNKSGDIIYKDY